MKSRSHMRVFCNYDNTPGVPDMVSSSSSFLFLLLPFYSARHPSQPTFFFCTEITMAAQRTRESSVSSYISSAGSDCTTYSDTSTSSTSLRKSTAFKRLEHAYKQSKYAVASYNDLPNDPSVKKKRKPMFCSSPPPYLNRKERRLYRRHQKREEILVLSAVERR